MDESLGFTNPTVGGVWDMYMCLGCGGMGGVGGVDGWLFPWYGRVVLCMCVL